MGSLWFAKNFVGKDAFIYSHADIMYDFTILEESYNGFKQNNYDMDFIVDFKKTDEEAMKVLCDDNHYYIESNKEIPVEKAHGEWTGIAFINSTTTQKVFDTIENVMKQDLLNVYDTHAFTDMVKSGTQIHCSPTNGKKWVEIDFEKDLMQAEKDF
jgi:choline kinase